MTGFVWQLYGPEIPDQIMRGVVFPEAVQEAYQAEEVWRVEEEDGTEQIGWYFSGTFRQNFDYRLYPFDRQDIWLRIWSPEPAEGVMPVPDFDAYRDLTPSTLPGIDTQFVYGGWDPLSSAFSYDLIDYNVDFGLSNGFSGAPDPELYFNLSVARDFLGPMLEHLVLEGAIAILLFFLLLLMAHDSDLQDRIGLTIFDLIVPRAVSSSPSFSISTPSGRRRIAGFDLPGVVSADPRRLHRAGRADGGAARQALASSTHRLQWRSRARACLLAGAHRLAAGRDPPRLFLLGRTGRR